MVGTVAKMETWPTAEMSGSKSTEQIKPQDATRVQNCHDKAQGPR